MIDLLGATTNIERLGETVVRNRDDLDATIELLRDQEAAERKAGRGRGERIRRLRWARHSVERAKDKLNEAVGFMNEAAGMEGSAA